MDKQSNATTLWTGKRTGIRVALEPEYDDYGMEDPAMVFAAAQPPRRTLDLQGQATPLNVPILTQTDVSVEVQSVKTASPERIATKDAPEEQIAANNDDFPIEDDDNVEQEEDDLLPPPPPLRMDGEDDGTESGDEVGNSEVNRTPNKETGDSKGNGDETDEDEDEQQDVLNQKDEDADMVDEQNGDDDDDQGGGFDMTAESAVTPPSPNKEHNLRLTSRTKKQVRIQTPQEETSTEEEESVNEPPKKKKKRTKKNRNVAKVTPKGRPQARTYEEFPLSAFRNSDDEEDQKGVRRSKRVHLPPLEFWKGENYIYGPNDFGDEFDGVRNMSVVKGVIKPNPTPYKKPPSRRDTKTKSKSSTGKKKTKRSEEDEDAEEFDTFELEKMYEINEGESANLANEYTDEISRTSKCWIDTKGGLTAHTTHFLVEVVSRFNPQVHQDLPLPKGQRTKREGKKTGKATQCFNLVAEFPGAPSFISGTLILPPKAIKDAESVLSNVQEFTVCDCQPNALEVAYADPREEDNMITDESAEHFLLKQFDKFHVPAGNAYRLVNHSKTKHAVISWTIVRNTAEEEEETYGDDGEEED